MTVTGEEIGHFEPDTSPRVTNHRLKGKPLSGAVVVSLTTSLSVTPSPGEGLVRKVMR